MIRLETIAKNLVVKLKAASPEKQRFVGLVACRLALQNAPVDDPIIVESLDKLQQFGVLPHNLIEALNSLVDQLDTKYFDLKDKTENSEDNLYIQSEYLRFFSQARTVAALSFAGGKDAFIATTEAIYEASATNDDSSKFFDEILKVLS